MGVWREKWAKDCTSDGRACLHTGGAIQSTALMGGGDRSPSAR